MSISIASTIDITVQDISLFYLRQERKKDETNTKVKSNCNHIIYTHHYVYTPYNSI